VSSFATSQSSHTIVLQNDTPAHPHLLLHPPPLWPIMNGSIGVFLPKGKSVKKIKTSIISSPYLASSTTSVDAQHLLLRPPQRHSHPDRQILAHQSSSRNKVCGTLHSKRPPTADEKLRLGWTLPCLLQPSAVANLSNCAVHRVQVPSRIWRAPRCGEDIGSSGKEAPQKPLDPFNSDSAHSKVKSTQVSVSPCECETLLIIGLPT